MLNATDYDELALACNVDWCKSVCAMQTTQFIVLKYK